MCNLDSYDLWCSFSFQYLFWLITVLVLDFVGKKVVEVSSVLSFKQGFFLFYFFFFFFLGDWIVIRWFLFCLVKLHNWSLFRNKGPFWNILMYKDDFETKVVFFCVILFSFTAFLLDLMACVHSGFESGFSTKKAGIRC